MIPAPDDARWQRVLHSRTDITNVSLATRLLVSRLRRELRDDPAAAPDKVEELRAFFAKNPNAQPDIAKF